MKHSLSRTFAIGLGLFVPFAATAQQTSFADVASGTFAPASIKIADLSPEYKAVRLRSAGESSPGMMGGLTGIMMMSGMAGGANAGKAIGSMMQVSALNDLSWTKGETVTIGGNAFLVTYRLNTGLDTATVGAPAPKMAASLTLNLLRTDSIISIAPAAEMTPDQMRKILSAAGVTVDRSPLQTSVSNDEAITSAILYPVFAQAKVATQQTQALSNAKQIAIAALMYSADSDDLFPYVQSTSQARKLTRPYSKTDEIWKTANPNGGGFRFAMNLAGVAVSAIENPAEAPLVYEANAWPDGRRVVAFADGHAKRVTRQEWTKIEPMLRRKYPRAAKRPIPIG